MRPSRIPPPANSVSAFISRLFLLWIIGGLMAPLVRAQQESDFTYAISYDNSAAAITGYTGADGAVTIPDAIAGLPVIWIANRAFQNNLSVTSVTIPSSVTSIGPEAFDGCTSLTSVTVPSSVISIGESAFRGCAGLASVTIPDGVTDIGSAAFAGCHGLTSIAIPASVLTIQVKAFSNCKSLVNITVAANNRSYRSLDGVLFNKEATSLVQYPGGRAGEYVIPSSVISAETYAFFDCVGLTGITIPANANSGAFTGCVNLLNIEAAADHPIYRSVDGVLFNKEATWLFRYPPGRTGSYVIPDGVTTIYGSNLDSAFWNCAGLTGVAIPNSVTSIQQYAFTGCTGLTTITLPDSVTGIGDYAFNGCLNLAGLTLGKDIVTIGNHAFQSCESLANVTFPPNIAAIYSNAFDSCSSLGYALFEGNAPLNYGISIFNHTAPGFTVYYRQGSSGFAPPTWNGYPAVMLTTSVPTLADWRKQHFGEGAANSGDAADEADPDGDGFTNIEEYVAGTAPKSAGSQWQLTSAIRAETSSTVTLAAQPGRRYALQRLVPAPGAAWQTVATQEPLAIAAPVSLTDPAAPADAALYRVQALLP